MGICGSSSPDITIVPNKYTLDVDNDSQKNCFNAKQSDSSIKINSSEGVVKKTDIQENNKTNKKSDKILFNIQKNENKKEEVKKEVKKENNNIQNNNKINGELSFKNKIQIINNDNNDNKENNKNNKNSNFLNVIESKGTKKRSISTHELTEISDLVKRKEKKKVSNPKFSEIKKVMFDTSTIKSKDEREKETKDEKTKNEKDKKYQRRNKKSTTLVEKSRLESKFQEEMKICVLNQTLIEEQRGDPSKKYKVLKRLGDGSYGTVFSVINNQTGLSAAMKKIEKVKENEIDDLEIKNEIDILKKLDHPNIVKIYEFYDTLTDFFIVTEYCKRGELYSYIKNYYSENQLAVLFYQVFSGLSYLHENNILHRDLKLENIMISEIEKDLNTKEDYFWIKIIDFGTAKIFKKNKIEKAVVGSSYYIAPEVLKQKYNEKCDTWSVGVILYMLIVGRAPFDGKSDEDIIESIKIGVYNNKHPKLLARSKEVQNLVSCLLERKISRRLSAFEALNHPFFTKFNGRALFCNFNEDEIQSYLDNLLNYKFQSKFQQLVLAFVVHNIPQSKETKIILKLFRYFNLSGNCKLTKVELINGLYQFRDKDKVDKVIDDIFLMLDGDNNGYIEYEEFLRACIDKSSALNNDNLKYAFKFLDKDNSGTLSVEKIMKAFVKKGNDTLKKIFKNSIKEVDKDNDGIINFNDFRELMRRVQ